ncbi:MAG: hypothetical protein KKE86_02465 [Planctomycetes bacterium]|nr:hypothetical protein [Planctomycetota bacterium]MBU4398181.1 hypothetical protein [Planctomycetota bacterium]MCG2685320.1 hypothetical protein [Planctomycetales bacterium]
MKRTTFSAIVLTVIGGLFLPSLRALIASDDARAEAEDIRKLSGKRLTLYTDLTGAEIDRLPAVFDRAFPQWCRYFGLDENRHADWRMTGFLMKDKARFTSAGFLPADLPPFPHGFSRGSRLWLYEQPSDYYRRHLLLHEGTHGFMNTLLGGCGPPWYMEGMAEYLGTHRLQDGRLTLGYMPRDREETPEWGRIRIIQDAVAQRRALRLDDVINMPPTAHRVTEPYAWCWAAVTLLDRHPRYQKRFRRMVQFVRERDFNARFRRLFADDWRQLCEEWQLMTAGMEYGYDVTRCAVDFTPAKAPPLLLGERLGVRAVAVAVDRGWQNSGLRLESGKKYRLTASGRYKIAATSPLPLGEGQGVRADASQKPKVWWCEPGGVSIRYYKGRPLGILLAAVRPDDPPPGSTSALLRPTSVGLGATIIPAESGTLFLKINDSPGELHDNAGKLKVEVRRE